LEIGFRQKSRIINSLLHRVTKACIYG